MISDNFVKLKEFSENAQLRESIRQADIKDVIRVEFREIEANWKERRNFPATHPRFQIFLKNIDTTDIKETMADRCVYK